MPHIGYFPPREFPNPLNIGDTEVVPQESTYDWTFGNDGVSNLSALGLQVFRAPVILPHGARFVKVTLYGYRTNTEALLRVSLQRLDRSTGALILAQLIADWTGGYGNIETTTFAEVTVDNINYHYRIVVEIDPDAEAYEVRFCDFVIDWN